MPEMTVTVRWPDGSVKNHYSSSLVMHDHMQAGATYTVADFAARAQAGLDEASKRVHAKYGFYCTSAAGSAARIRELAAAYPPGATVEVLAMEPPLPGGPAVTGSAPAAAPATTSPASLRPQEPR
jgi:uncharacterized repeat protein (TIGR04042 family)